jgi:nucleoside-diphosphate-sugar epimerase
LILVTGSAGLIGKHLCARLRLAGMDFRQFDIRHCPDQDIQNREWLQKALEDVTGVVHLAAVSRVIWGERDPANCLSTNVTALRGLVEMLGSRRWLIFASSREVYGMASRLPVREDAPLRPMNVYGRSKQAGEAIVQAARESGMLTNICRFSNVFGCAQDHPDRVVMAFAAVAARGGVMSIEGSGNLFDFTAVEDAVEGLFRLIEATNQGERLAPIHFVSGQGTTLRGLAEIAASHAVGNVSMVESEPRSFDVPAFVGDPSRADHLLGWRAQRNLDDRVAQLVADLAAGMPAMSSAKTS